mmetsp:Transcript_25320/g.80122  ORF Transcript_25320/g.80122 Transcript_25320/m.80122 type:complete len:736 (-) Transcript_25320:24-2231(-)|eukprot:CAMPEP_0182908190 /NCGR_PEP_ID=MMETSP0034_2-20130328/35059_1 /TAXON_ID=156128 /ORGANISM="Nephroselmis pyriformis, Strain CCMP717" /LENGTH=735 /DNA_ID=CAMNT_0025044333 /DNA_START=315 /DNA_END=2522 /DNA_ORIENTATION=+
MSAPKKKTFRIEPFKHRVEMDPNYAEKTWKILEDAIHEINNHNASGLSFEELYRNAYNMVLHKFGDKLYSGLVDTIERHLEAIAGYIEAAQGHSFLVELNKRWADHNKSLRMIRDILMYMDRTYVTQQKKTPVHELGLNLWRDNIVRLESIHGRLTKTLLDLIHKERTGEMIDRALMKSTTQMLMDLGQAVYQDDFEKPFVKAAAAFYKVEAQEYIASSDCPEYLKKAERRLQEEIERVQTYLDPSSEAQITSVVETELIGSQMRVLIDMENSGLVPMLQHDKYDDLARMYMMFKRVGPKALQELRTVMQEHVQSTGKGLVMDPERAADPIEYVQRLLEEKDKYDALILNSFQSDKSFQNSVNQAFENFVNLNARSPEFIALFVDDKLRKGLKGATDIDVDAVLDKVMMLFRFLQEKDVFEKYYKQHLAKRLLSGRTVSDDAERSLIVKLKTECGYQFTSKLEGMFTDMKTSSDTMAQFKSMVESKNVDMGGVELSVQVLTTGSWPTQAGGRCNVPPVLEHCCNKFRDFYLSTHTGRRLTWQLNMGNVDLKATFGTSKHEINVSTYQMVVLLLFNDNDRMSYTDIAETTDIPAPELKRNLQSLACVKGKNVLRKEPMSKEVNESDIFIFNDKYQSKLYKVKIGTVAAQKETEPEKQETRQKVEEDRKPQIEAAVVRIMKARKVLDHNNIIAEVTRQLSARFMPNPSVIKKRIESLIEREFIERDKVDRKLYRYLA